MDKKYVIGIDLGGTNTVFGIVDANGNIIAQNSIKTQKHKDNVNLYIDELCNELTALIDQTGGKNAIKGIGIGAPNGNYYTGNIEFAPNLPWQHVLPLSKMITEKIHLPCKITNDANAAAIGEMTYGIAKGMKNFILITLGTGVGSGIVINGKVVYGHDGFAGELGHTIAIHDGRPCPCGRCGCLETYTSATGVVRTAIEFLSKSKEDSLLRAIPSNRLESKDVYDAAVKGDKIALDIFNYTGTILGQSIANFVAFSAPEAVILFGGLTKAGEFLLKPTRIAMEKDMLRLWSNKIKVLVSSLKESNAAVLGASALGWECEE